MISKVTTSTFRQILRGKYAAPTTMTPTGAAAFATCNLGSQASKQTVCKYSSKTIPNLAMHRLASTYGGNNGHIIGLHPDDGRPIRLRIGRFGEYLQWGEQGENNTTTHSLPGNFTRYDTAKLTDWIGNVETTISLEDAIFYIHLPRVLGEKEGSPITLKLGRDGTYIKWKNVKILVFQRINGKNINVSLPSTFNTSSFSTIQLQQAWELISNKLEKDQSSNTGKRGIKASKLISTTIKEESIPPRPRRPMSAYLYFCAEKRPDVSKTVKSLSEISKAFSTMWSQLRLVPKGIEPYEVQASQAKARYEQEMTEWRRLCDPISTKNETSFPTNNTAHALYHDAHSKESLQTTVKRSPSAYMIFCRENRDKVSINADGERLRLGDVTKHLAKLWKECDEETKDEYRVKAKQFAASSMLS